MIRIAVSENGFAGGNRRREPVAAAGQFALSKIGDVPSVTVGVKLNF